ncbi:MAG: DNRLRE domain-containing protein [bacterium]
MRKNGIDPAPELVIDTGAGGPTQYTLTVNTGGSGSVVLNPAGGVYDEGTVVTLTANPAAGWIFSSWSGALAGSTNPETLTMNADKTVTATFTQAPPNQFTLSVTTSGSGTVDLNPTGGTYDEGTVVTLTANPFAGWDFTSWSGDLTGSVNPELLTMNANKNVTATFTATGGDTSTFSFNPTDDARVRENFPTTNYGGGTELIVRKSGSNVWQYAFLKFNVSGVTGTLQNAKIRLNVVDASVDGGGIYAVSNNYAGISSPWDEGGLTWDNAPTISGAALSSLGAVSLNQTVEFDVTAAITGDGIYSFGIKSSDNDAVKYSSKEGAVAPLLVIQTTGGAPQQYTLTVNTSGSGTVDLNPPGGTYTEGTSVTVTANPASGWQFDNWSGALTGATNPNSILMDADKNVTANFSQIPPNQYTLTVNTAGSGTVDLTPPGGVYDDGTVVTLDAIPAANWQFSSWSGALTGNTNPETITMNANKTVTATFDSVTSTPGTFTFNPSQDARVYTKFPNTNYGSSTSLSVRKTSTQSENSYLKFIISGLSGAIQSALLRLYVTNASNDGGSIYSVSNDYQGTSNPWDENGLTSANAPIISGAPLSALGTVALDTWVEFDVTAAVNGNGTLSFALQNSSTDKVQYSSKQGLNPPELIITTSGVSDPPPAATLSLTATEVAGGIQLNWTANTETDMQEYRIYRSFRSGSGFELLAAVSHPSTSYLDDKVTSGEDQFGQIIGYNVKNHIAKGLDSLDFAGQFNGNIAWTTHNTRRNTAPAGLTGWIFQYDNANRLTKANWGYKSTNWQTSAKYDLASISYDQNGNITSMTRKDENGSGPAMAYNYLANTNKLDYVFNLNSQASGNYQYDPNGNLKKDLAKLGATAMTYDYRNLPTVVPAQANTITFDYDGSGQRTLKNNLVYVRGLDGSVLAVYDKATDKHLYWNVWGLDLIGQRFVGQ